MAANAQLAGAPIAEDVTFMRMAIEEARLADFPFGAVIVRDGAVIARGSNLGRTNQDPTAHGEMDAIRKCLSAHGPAALRGSTLYTSGEPCAMCMGAILWCHVRRLVFAASMTQLATKIDQIMVSSAQHRGQSAICTNGDHRRRAG
jgi:tRNA(Arg) A34 adenosine deaminase TadA